MKHRRSLQRARTGKTRDFPVVRRNCESSSIIESPPTSRADRQFWARGYFLTTSGNVTDDIIMQYLELHSDK